MADNSVVQTIKDAEIDARSLSEFVSEDADFVVSRRLAPTIHTLEYYLQTLNSVDNLAQQAQSAISATVDEVTRLEPRIVQMVNDAIDATAIPEGLVDTLVTVTKTTSNAIARSQSSLNSDYINVKNYGAKGDGITDDTPAFENAIADAPAGSTIYAPQGKYRLTSGLQWKTKLSLKGSGVGNTILYMDGTLFSAIVCVDGRPSSGLNPDGTPFDEPLEDCHFEDFEIDGSGLTHPEAAVGGKGIFILFMRRALFRNLYIHHTIGTGLGCDFLEDSVIDSCNVSYCGRNRGLGSLSIGQSGIGIGTGWQSKENVVVSNCVTNHNGNYGVFVELQTGSLNRDFKPNGAVFVNCYAEGNNVGFCNKASGATLMSNCYALKNETGFFTTSTRAAYNTIIGCRSEDNTGHGFSIAHGGGLDSLTNCVSANNGKAGYNIVTETDGVGYLSGNGASISNCIAYNNIKESVKISANIDALEHGFYRIDSCLLLSAGDYGVYAAGAKNLKISNSIISKNGSTGVRVLSVPSNSDIDIQSNKVIGNVGSGVHLTITRNAYAKVSDNTITDNTENGVVIGGANTIAMINNNIIGNYDESKLQRISLIIDDALGGQYSVLNNTLGLNSSSTTYNLLSGALATFRGNTGAGGSGRPSNLQMTGSPYTLPRKGFDCMYYFSSSEPITARFGSDEAASGNSVSLLVPANTEDVTIEYTSSVKARIQSH